MKQTAEHVWDWLRRVLSVGQSIVIVGALVGVALFVRELGSQDEDLYPALLKGLGAMSVMMIVLGVVREFWGDRRVSTAQGPGGTGGVGFDDETKATLERVVFKTNESGTTTGSSLFCAGSLRKGMRMAREHNSENNRATTSADERYREFAKDNAAWDTRVKKSIAKIGKSSRGRAARHAAGS